MRFNPELPLGLIHLLQGAGPIELGLFDGELRLALFVLLLPFVLQAAHHFLLLHRVGELGSAPAVVDPRARIAQGLLAPERLGLRHFSVIEHIGRHEYEQFLARFRLRNGAEEPLANPGYILEERNARFAFLHTGLRKAAEDDGLAVFEHDVGLKFARNSGRRVEICGRAAHGSALDRLRAAFLRIFLLYREHHRAVRIDLRRRLDSNAKFLLLIVRHRRAVVRRARILIALEEVAHLRRFDNGFLVVDRHDDGRSEIFGAVVGL